MPESSNPSFIPKHSTSKVERKNTPRRVFLGTIIVRILFFVVLIVAIGTYAYDTKVRRDFDTIRMELGNKVSSIDTTSLDQVIAFDGRLKLANEIWQETPSVVSLLDLVGQRTLTTVQIRKLDISRQEDDTFLINADLLTGSYDSIVNQRKAFTDDERITLKRLSEATMQFLSEAKPAAGQLPATTVSAQAELIVPISAVKYLPVTFSATPFSVVPLLVQGSAVNQIES